MSSKMNYIPYISSYEDIRAEMSNDLQYRVAEEDYQNLSRTPSLLPHQCPDDYDTGVSVPLPLLLGTTESHVGRQ